MKEDVQTTLCNGFDIYQWFRILVNNTILLLFYRRLKKNSTYTMVLYLES